MLLQWQKPKKLPRIPVQWSNAAPTPSAHVDVRPSQMSIVAPQGLPPGYVADLVPLLHFTGRLSLLLSLVFTNNHHFTNHNPILRRA